METDSSVKDILYQELNKITEKKIQFNISSGQSSKIIHKIIGNCYPKIFKNNGDIDENVGIFAESLMHYLLTISLIPSQRKILHDKVEIDIVIPDLRTLKANPKDSIVIYFPKVSNIRIIKQRILELEKIQTIKENLWIVIHTNLHIKNRTYIIDNFDESFTKILDDIMKFLSSKKQSKLKIIRT